MVEECGYEVVRGEIVVCEEGGNLVVVCFCWLLVELMED